MFYSFISETQIILCDRLNDAQEPVQMTPYLEKRDFADVIKLWIQTWRDYPGLFECAQCNPMGLHKREAE